MLQGNRIAWAIAQSRTKVQGPKARNMTAWAEGPGKQPPSSFSSPESGGPFPPSSICRGVFRPAPGHISVAAPAVRSDDRKNGEGTSAQPRLWRVIGILAPLPGLDRHPPKLKWVNHFSENLVSQLKRTRMGTWMRLNPLLSWQRRKTARWNVRILQN